VGRGHLWGMRHGTVDLSVRVEGRHGNQGTCHLQLEDGRFLFYISKSSDSVILSAPFFPQRSLMIPLSEGRPPGLTPNSTPRPTQGEWRRFPGSASRGNLRFTLF
jgi:hypothetical protein